MIPDTIREDNRGVERENQNTDWINLEGRE